MCVFCSKDCLHKLSFSIRPVLLCCLCVFGIICLHWGRFVYFFPVSLCIKMFLWYLVSFRMRPGDKHAVIWPRGADVQGSRCQEPVVLPVGLRRDRPRDSSLRLCTVAPLFPNDQAVELTCTNLYIKQQWWQGRRREKWWVSTSE